MNLPALKGKNLILALTVPSVVVLDQLTKWLAIVYLKPLRGELRPEDRVISVIDGCFNLRFDENPGAAWGLFRGASESFRVPFFLIVSVLAIGFIIWFFRKIDAKQRLLPLAVSLVLGGAVGNLIDRLRMGKVVDFIVWYLRFESPVDLKLFTIEAGEKAWPTFNIADVAITIGVALLIIEMLFTRKKPAEPAAADAGRA